MKKNNAFRRAAALMAALSITVSLAAPAFAGTYYIDYGDITITKNADGSQTVQHGKQDGTTTTENDSGEIIITTSNADKTTMESDLEGPAAEDSGFGPVVEDNYQPAAPAQPKDAEEPKDADQPESAEEPKSVDQPENTDRQEDADRQENTDRKESAEEPEDADRKESADRQAQPQQAALTAADDPATSTPANGFWGNTITVINKVANTVLNLTLRDVKIDVSDNRTYGDETGKAALSVQGKGSVEIELDGKNELKSGYKRAGLEKTSEGTLTLKDDKKKAGSLTATGGKFGAGIGGGDYGSGKNITITGGTVNAAGGEQGAGIGGGTGGSGENITINGGTVEATGGDFGAGIGGGSWGSGSNVTVSGAAQVTAIAGKPDRNGVGAGATIGNGDSMTEDGELVDGKKIQADISGLTTTGYIRHIIYNLDGSVKQEWWEYGHLQPAPDTPNAPAEESNEVDLGTPGLHVETLEGDLLPFDARQQGSTLRVTSNTLAARLHGTRQALETLQEQGVEQIQFVTTLKTTTLSVAELLAEGGSWFALEHDGLVSRQLSAAQAESLKCQMR